MFPFDDAIMPRFKFAQNEVQLGWISHNKSCEDDCQFEQVSPEKVFFQSTDANSAWSVIDRIMISALISESFYHHAQCHIIR